MGCHSGRVIEKQLTLENKIDFNEECDQYIFSKCRNIKPRNLNIYAKQTNGNWQVGFFDADGEVYFDKIEIGSSARFSSIVRNYWWNGKEGKEKKEGYYSLIKSVKQLEIHDQHVNDLLDYVEGRYEAGEHWRLHKLDKTMELRIKGEVEETTVDLLLRHFDNIQCNEITANLKTENSITCNCDWYKFKHCKGVEPQRLTINAVVNRICFKNTGKEVHVPEVVIEEKADLRSIIQNKYGDNKYSLLSHIQTLIIKNNPTVLCDLADYINRRYKINDGWRFHELNKNINIVIEKPGIAFGAVKEIYYNFSDVLVDTQQAKDYVCKYINEFQNNFGKYGLETDRVGDFIMADDHLELGDQKLNVLRSDRKICQLTIKQKITSQQFICFHNTDNPVVINKIVIQDGGDLRCVLQNTYYNGTDAGFFSLLQTAKELEIQNDRHGDSQALADLVDYIEGKYTLNSNWEQEELDKDMLINMDNSKYGLSLNVARRLRNYFRNVSIDAIGAPLETENVIDQGCKDKYIFSSSREANPQKLVINAKLMGRRSLILLSKLIDNEILILFNQADGNVNIPEITIDEKGCFAAIVRNEWQNNKEGDEKKSGYYSLVQHVKTLIIRNNPMALNDLADYLVGKYKIENHIWEPRWELHQLSKNIKIVIEGPGDTFLPVLRTSNYFNEVTVDGKQPQNYLATWELWNDPDYKAFRTCFDAHGLPVDPRQYGVELQKVLKLVECVYNIRKSAGNIDSLIIRQKLDINQFVCFHDIDKPVNINKIVIEQNGDLRNVLQNAYYSNGQGGFFSLLKTTKALWISDNEQAAEDLADYINGEYALHPKWEKLALDKNMVIKIQCNNDSLFLDIAKRLRNYFRNVAIDCIGTPLETENVIDQECENKYIFSNCKNINPQKLVVNAKLAGNEDLIMFNDSDSEVYIPEITIGGHGRFDAIVRNLWWNCRKDIELRCDNYSLVLHVETLTIQNNPEAVCDLDRYISGDYEIQQYGWEVQKLSKNTIVRINGVSGLDEQIKRLKEYFDHIVIDGRKSLRDSCRQMLTHVNSKSSDIRQRQVYNKQKQQNINNSVMSIQDARQRIENARARLGRRRARFQEYLALTE